MVVSLSHNAANLVFASLKETDTGEYTCKCAELDLSENVRVKVKPFSKYFIYFVSNERLLKKKLQTCFQPLSLI